MKKLRLPVLVFGMFWIVLHAQDATRGAALYKQQCGSCHGDRLGGRSGPPLGGADFQSRLSTPDLITKIKNTMPQDDPGKLTAGQATDLAAYIQQAGKAVANAEPSTASKSTASAGFSATGNLNQLMRGIMFPNSNILFTVQTHDPAEKTKTADAANAKGGFNWSM
jgi:cytochrome c